jgi:sugar lactone lactonase YvrE
MTRLRTTHARRSVVALVLVTLVVGVPAGAAGSSPRPELIVLAGASSAEGIAAGEGNTFFAGDLFSGDVFRGDIARGTASLFIDAPEGRQAVGMIVDIPHRLLLVAGGFTGQAYVYDTTTGATVATYQLGAPGTSLINDVTLARGGAWFTDTFQAQLYFVPISATGVPGPAVTLPLSGPAADTSGQFNLNGIRATPDGSTLIVAHTANGALYTVDPTTGASSVIAGIDVPNVDGILFEAGRLWAVQNFSNQISRIRLSPDLSAGAVEEVITSDLFQVPATAGRFGNRLAVVNAKFDTGFPPTATKYEVVLVRR